MNQAYKKHLENAFHTTLAKSIIANQFAINLNDQLKHSKFYKANVKLYGKPFANALIQAEKKEFAIVDKTDTNAVDAVFEQLDSLILTMAQCPLIDYGHAEDAIKALAKDPKAMLKVINQILWE